MSRVGKEPIEVPASVTVSIKEKHISVKGSKGLLERDFHKDIDVVLQDNIITVTNPVESRKNNAFRGLTRSLINNMIIGVSDGFKKVMIIEGIGYKAKVSGQALTLNVGYSNPVDFKLPKGVNADVEGGTKILLESIDKELLGQTAAKIRQVRKPEPYKGKGIRFEDEHIARKDGKASAA